MGRDSLPNIPVTAVVWTVRAAGRPLSLGLLTTRCRERWGRYYGGIDHARVRSACARGVDRGWLAAPAPHERADIVAMADPGKFDLEHDPTLLRGFERATHEQSMASAVAWRRANR